MQYVSKPLNRYRMPLRTATALVLLVIPGIALASGGSDAGAGHTSYAMTFLWIGILLLLAKVSSLVEKVGQPAVLGELLMGVLLGNLSLLGIHLFDAVTSDALLKFLAELGVVILLFQIGLESNLKDMRKVGLSATLVAIVGVIVPFVLGAYVVGPWLLPGLNPNAYLFLGASLTATSVGVTARVFKDLGQLKTPEAQTVLGAAVIDDVIGLVILAVVSAIATVGAVSLAGVAGITAKALAFLVGAIVIGRIVAPILGKLLSRIQTGVGMKLTLALVFCLLTAAFAQMIGLAPIVGAFAAGLVLDPVHFRAFKKSHVVQDMHELTADQPEELKEKMRKALDAHSEKHVEELIEPIGHFLVPLFFVLTGMGVKLDALFRADVLPLALGITLAAIVGKIVAGVFAAKGSSKLLVGIGMVPRGEVGLIFAAIGLSLGVMDDRLYAIIVSMVIITTLLPPPVLAWMLRRNHA